MPIHKVYIGIGSNLDDPIKQVKTAIATLIKLAMNENYTCSSLYQSVAMVKPGQPPQEDYINAVMAIDTDNCAIDLLDVLQNIESTQGRIRGEERWTARTLDLDLLLFGDEFINHPRLTVPHYGLSERNFVIYPLRDIDANLQLPDGSNINDLYQSCSADGIRKIE